MRSFNLNGEDNVHKNPVALKMLKLIAASNFTGADNGTSTRITDLGKLNYKDNQKKKRRKNVYAR